MEHVSSAGLDIYLEAAPLVAGQCWSTEVAAGLWLGLMLEGHVAVEQPIFGTSEGMPGRVARFWSQDQVVSHHRGVASGMARAVFVRLAPDAIEPLLGSAASRLIQGLDDPCPLSYVPVLQSLAWQMMSCRLCASARRLYLIGKAMEMLAVGLRDRLEGAHTVCGRRAWTGAELEKLHAARALLIDRLDRPPLVPDLARQVGLNTRKLSDGFTDLFGQSVYAFVKGERLERAKAMLEAGETRIGHVARCAGYGQSHFSTEFRKRFGLAPTDILARRNPHN